MVSLLCCWSKHAPSQVGFNHPKQATLTTHLFNSVCWPSFIWILFLFSTGWPIIISTLTFSLQKKCLGQLVLLAVSLPFPCAPETCVYLQALLGLQRCKQFGDGLSLSVSGFIGLRELGPILFGKCKERVLWIRCYFYRQIFWNRPKT